MEGSPPEPGERRKAENSFGTFSAKKNTMMGTVSSKATQYYINIE